MTLFTITKTSPISDDYSNRTFTNIRELRCSMHRPRSLTSNIIVVAPPFYNNVLSRLWITRAQAIAFKTRACLALDINTRELALRMRLKSEPQFTDTWTRAINIIRKTWTKLLDLGVNLMNVLYVMGHQKIIKKAFSQISPSKTGSDWCIIHLHGKCA